MKLRILVLLAGLVLYGKTLSFGLTYLDDNLWVQDYAWYLHDFANGIKFFKQPDFISEIFYRPILNISFMINSHFGGSSPFLFHLTNILLHIINGWLLFEFLKNCGYKHDQNMLMTLIFVVHPVMTQAVAWIPGRTDSLLCLFMLSSLISFQEYVSTKRIWAYLLHLLCLVFALLTKETAVVLPVICLLYGFLMVDQRIKKSTLASLSIAWIVIIFCWLGLRKLILAGSPSLGIDLAINSLLANLPAIVSYWGKIFIPINLSVMPILEDLKLAYGLVAMIAITLLLLLSKGWRWRIVLFGILWFVILLLPSLVFSFLNHEYRLYIPLIGALMIFFELDIVKSNISNRRGRVIGVVVVVLLGVQTFVYSDQFKDRWAFWTNAVNHSPHSPLAHRNLGAMHYMEGRLDVAEQHYLAAIKLNPRENMVHNNLGLIYFHRNDFLNAEREYLAEIEINPAYETVFFNLGTLRYFQGRNEEAAELWKKTVVLNPRYVDAYKNLFVYYVLIKNYKEADHYLQELRRWGVQVPEQWEKILNDQG